MEYANLVLDDARVVVNFGLLWDDFAYSPVLNN